MTSTAAIEAAPKPSGRDNSTRNRQIVEGALLADIAVVLLLGRVYLPIPIVRTAWRLIAAAPFVLIAQRQGIRTAIMSGIVAYLLLTALIGPTLALTALDTAFAALIVAAALHWHWPRTVTAIVGGLVYAACDIVIPTIFFAAVFRVPIITIVHDARNGTRGAFRVISEIVQAIDRGLRSLFGSGAPQLPYRAIQDFGYAATAFLVAHWILFALIIAACMGVVNIFAYHAASDLVLDRLPASIRQKQVAAA